MATLLEISDDLIAFRQLLEELCDETGGELPPEVAESLDRWFAELDQNRDAKLDAYCALIREMTLRAAARREEAERLLKRVRVDENAAKRLKERLKMFLEIQGTKTLETKRFKLSLAANGGKPPLEVTCPVESLESRFQRTTVKADEDAIRAALEAGEAVVGARLLPRGTHLRIS